MAGLSEEEFHRYQQVLLELKSSKYQLEDEKRQLLSKVHMLENSLAKKDEIISRSKKTREFELLANENDTMRRKIFAQGEEFRLQSQTLMKEYSTLVVENEKLTSQLEAYRGGCADELADDKRDDPPSESDKQDQQPTDKLENCRQEIRELCKAKLSLEEEKASLEKKLKTIANEHELMTAELTKLKGIKTDLEAQNSNLKQCILSKEALHTNDLESLVAKHRKTVEELEESLIIRMQQLREEKEDALAKLKEEHRTEMEKLKEKMQAEMASLNSTHESHMASQQSDVEKLKEAHEDELQKLKESHEHELEELRQLHNSELDKKDCALSEKDKEHEGNVESLKSEVAALKQLAEDLRNSIKIQEKKSASSMRDLKKQLIAEARRADELQRRLEEVMVDATSRQSLEELFRPPVANRLMDDGGGSLRSWNASNSGLGTESSVANTGGNAVSPNGGVASAAALFGFTGEDVRLMIQRLTETQQENCLLKERVAHLEESNACYADDLRHKSAIIERYVSSSHVNAVTGSPVRQSNAAPGNSNSAPSGSQNGVARDLERLSAAVKSRFGDILKSDAETTNKNVQRNLQRLLEETLTKNIHLEESLLLLTTELESTKERLKEVDASEGK